MKKLLFALLVVLTRFCASAQENRWSVYGGVSMSHPNSTTDSFFDKGWGAGGFIGASYDIAFNRRWSLQPSLQFSYIHEPASTIAGGGYCQPIVEKFLDNCIPYPNVGTDSYNLEIPVLVNFRVHFNDNVGMRFGVGPYLTETINKDMGSFGERFNIGGKVEVAVETGKHWSYQIGCQYPFMNGDHYHVISDMETFSFGVRYSF